MWVLDHLDDLRADFRAIYHITEDIEELEAIQFQRFAYRATAYRGIMRARAENDEEQKQQHKQGGEETNEVPGNTGALRLSPSLAGVIDFK
jgi:hypothetical protein